MSDTTQELNAATPAELVRLVTKKEFEEEGQALYHALPYFFDFFEKEGLAVYSVRQGGTPVLTLSVKPEGYTEHIVGMRNRHPTPAELDIVTDLLKQVNIENRYNPKTIC